MEHFLGYNVYRIILLSYVNVTNTNKLKLLISAEKLISDSFHINFIQTIVEDILFPSAILVIPFIYFHFYFSVFLVTLL